MNRLLVITLLVLSCGNQSDRKDFPSEILPAIIEFSTQDNRVAFSQDGKIMRDGKLIAIDKATYYIIKKCLESDKERNQNVIDSFNIYRHKAQILDKMGIFPARRTFKNIEQEL